MRTTLLLTFLCLSLTSACRGDGDDRVVVDEGAGDETETVEPAPPDTENTDTDNAEPAADGELVVGEDACQTDDDCRPAGCCHAAACVGAANAPDCTDVMCTADCRADTIDCGGGCLCHEGRCAARLWRAPTPTLAPE